MGKFPKNTVAILIKCPVFPVGVYQRALRSVTNLVLILQCIGQPVGEMSSPKAIQAEYFAETDVNL